MNNKRLDVSSLIAFYIPRKMNIGMVYESFNEVKTWKFYQIVRSVIVI